MKFTLNLVIQLLHFIFKIFKNKKYVASSMEINTFRLCKIYTKVVFLDDKCVLIITFRDDQEQQQVWKRYARGYPTNNIWSLQISFVQKNYLPLFVIMFYFLFVGRFSPRFNMSKQTFSDICQLRRLIHRHKDRQLIWMIRIFKNCSNFKKVSTFALLY